MVQTWNQMCFSTTARVEVALRMPGRAGAKGLWPAAWAMGNLARAGYQALTDGVWPYNYNACDAGITPNQLSLDGLLYLPGQRLCACTCSGEDHPSPGRGRGAPEIDLVEGAHDKVADWALAVQTLQAGPFDPWWRPDYGYMTIGDEHTTFMRPDTGNPVQEAIAAATVLDPMWFESLASNSNASNSPSDYQVYAFEYVAGTSHDYIEFSVGGRPTLTVHGDALHPQGSVLWREIPREPMSLVFNLGLSPDWSDIDFGSLLWPATLLIDYVRVYQKSPELSCDPSDFPTGEYIQDHLAAYTNANLSSWNQAGFKAPKNSLMHGCVAAV